MTSTSPTPGDHANPEDQTVPRQPAPSLDAIGKQMTLDAALEHARLLLRLETLESRGRDALDFHEIPVGSIKDIVRHAFGSGYRDGLHTGYRQGRSDACDEALGHAARTQPRNPDLNLLSDPTTDQTTSEARPIER